MNCEEVQRIKFEYLDEELPAARAEAVAVHLENCPRCREEISGLRAAWDLLDLHPEASPSGEFIARTMASFRAVRSRERFTTGVRRSAVLAAAVLLAALTLVLFREPDDGFGTSVAVTEDEVIENLDLIEDLELLQQIGEDLEMAMEYDLFEALGGEESL